MDHRETERFITRLYAPGEEFEVAYIHPTKEGREKVRRVVRMIEPVLGDETGMGDSATVIGEMARAEEAGYNVYISALPVSLQNNAYDAVWVDQDDPSAPYPFASDERWEGGQWPEPTTLVKTSDADGGFRWQAIWKLNTQLTVDEGRSFIKRLARRAGADESVHDPRRVLRVPGIMNAKRGSMARLISTSQSETSIEAFDLPDVGLVDKLLTADVQNPAHVLGEWLEGVHEGDRNRKAYVAARFLKSCGVTIDDALPILKLGAQRANPPLPDDELLHSTKSAYHRA